MPEATAKDKRERDARGKEAAENSQRRRLSHYIVAFVFLNF